MVDAAKRVVLRAEIAYRGKATVAHTLELSTEGVFVQTDEFIGVGERVLLRLSFPGLVEPVELAARVTGQRVVRGPGEPRGLQLEFLLDDDHQRERLGALLERTRGTRPPTAPATAEYRVLVVDDNGIIRDMFTYGVRKYFHGRQSLVTVDVAEDGKQAWEKLSKGGYSLAIIDYYLPVMKGSELVARVRNQTGTSSLPVVVISVGGAAAREASLAAGADLFLDKPIVLRDLFSTLDRLTASWEGA